MFLNRAHFEQQVGEMADTERVHPIVKWHVTIAFLYHEQKAGQCLWTYTEALHEF